MMHSEPHRVLMEAVAKPKVTASEGKIGFSFEIHQIKSAELAELITIAHSGVCHITVTSAQAVMPIGDSGPTNYDYEHLIVGHADGNHAAMEGGVHPDCPSCKEECKHEYHDKDSVVVCIKCGVVDEEASVSEEDKTKMELDAHDQGRWA